MIERVLAKTGATVWSWERIYKAVVQSVLLYVSERWVVTGDMLKILEGFHQRADRQITGMTATRGADREWEYPPVEAEMEAAVLPPIIEYIRIRQENTTEKVACCPIYEICIKVERMPRRYGW